jgi:hypothetical protein
MQRASALDDCRLYHFDKLDALVTATTGRFIVRADEKLTAFLELEASVRASSNMRR